jgi:protocatechuate 3,4-dioxygenase alpha subunit
MSFPTPSQTVGPFFGFALPFESGGECVAEGVRVEGQVLDGAGEPVPDALVEVAQGDEFGRCRTDDEGAFAFTVSPTSFLNVTVFARGLLRHLNTRMYFPGEEDEVLASIEADRRHTVIARRDGEVLRFDIRLQGADETVFFE